jgi:hypothetical protein
MRDVKRSLLHRLLVQALSIVAACSVVACPADPEPQPNETSPTNDAAGTESDDGAAFWSILASDADWAEYHATLTDLTQGADVTLLGRIDSVRLSRRVTGDVPEDVSFEATFSIVPTELLHGSLAQSEVMDLVVLLPGALSDEDAQAEVEHLGSNKPSDPIVVFGRLRASGDYRVVNGYGIWADTARAPIDTPLNSELPSAGPYAQEVDGLSSLTELVDVIRGIGDL